MKKEHTHYSDKGNHKERSLYWKAVEKIRNKKVCCGKCEECPLVNDIQVANGKVIYKAKP